MRFSSLTQRIRSKGSQAWDLHFEAVRRMAEGEVAPDTYLLLSVGDPDFETPRAITDAAIASLNAGRTHYTDMSGTAELRAILADDYAARIGAPVRPDQVTVVAGAQNALFAACQVLLDPGDDVIVFDPMYVTYRDTLGVCGVRPVAVPTWSEDDFLPRAEQIEAAITPATRAILVNDPNNPTGAVMSEAIWRDIARIAIAHDVWVIVDEVYRALHFPGTCVPFTLAALPGMAERTVVVSSLSKSHAMTGWRLGWTIGPAAYGDHAAKLNIVMLYGGPEFIQDAACVALRDACAAATVMAQAYAARAQIVVQTLQRSTGLRPIVPRAGMFVMVDVRPCGVSAPDFAAMLFEQAGVVVLAGDAFGERAAGHIRIGLVVPPVVLQAACEKICALAERLIQIKTGSRSAPVG
jgi:arginine:pyruvate transaminase